MSRSFLNMYIYINEPYISNTFSFPVIADREGEGWVGIELSPPWSRVGNVVDNFDSLYK